MSPNDNTTTTAPEAPAKVFVDEINFTTAAELAGIQDQYFRKLVKTGKVPAQKNSQGFWRFSKAAILDWAANRSKMPRTRSGASDGRKTYKVRLNETEADLVQQALGENIVLQLQVNHYNPEKSKAYRAARKAKAVAEAKG